RNGATQPREIGKRGVGGQREDDEDGADGHVVEPSAAGDGGDKHRQYALVARLAGVGGRDPVGANEIGDASEENNQETDDDGQRALGGFDRRLPERAHAIADGLDASHRGTAVGEYLQQQPQTDDSGWRWQRRPRRDDGDGMSTREDRV